MLHTLEEVKQTSSNLQNAQRVQGYYVHRRRQANDAHIVKQRNLGTKRFELERARKKGSAHLQHRLQEREAALLLAFRQPLPVAQEHGAV
jgi:hypothetical protein